MRMMSEKIPHDVVAVATAVAGADASPIDTLAPMAGGASGALLFTMVMNGVTYVVRKPGTFGGPLDREKLDRALDCMRIASDLGVAPELIHADQATGITVVRKIEGTPVTRGTPRDTDPLGKLAHTLRTLHGGPAMAGEVPPGPYRKFSMMLAEQGRTLPAQLVPTIEAAAAELAGGPIAPCHRDLNPTNLIMTPERVYLIDWDTAGPADPLFDIALASVWLCRDAAERIRFLTSYLERAPDPAELRRLEVNRVMAFGFYGIGFHALAAMQGQPIVEDGLSLEQLFARMASGGMMFTMAEMAAALVSEALREAKAAGLLS
jgi:aminoglycoside phosphotransferase (APT) family kinase protein